IPALTKVASHSIRATIECQSQAFIQELVLSTNRMMIITTANIGAKNRLFGGRACCLNATTENDGPDQPIATPEARGRAWVDSAFGVNDTLLMRLAAGSHRPLKGRADIDLAKAEARQGLTKPRPVGAPPFGDVRAGTRAADVEHGGGIVIGTPDVIGDYELAL